MNSQDYIEVSIFIENFSEEKAEIVEAEIEELPYDSFVIDNNPGTKPVLKAYIRKDLYDLRQLKILLSGLDFATSISSTMIPAENWNAEWESSFTPMVVDNTVTVKAEIKNKVVMDMGCGTGILAILAAKMQAARVFGIDIDAVAARSVFDNAHINRVSKRVETYYGDASLLQAGKYNVILANIHKNIIILDLQTYSRSLTIGGLLIVSGFYKEDCAEIIHTASDNGLSLVSRHSRDEWACLEFKKE